MPVAETLGAIAFGSFCLFLCQNANRYCQNRWPDFGRQTPAPAGNQPGEGNQSQGTNDPQPGGSEHLARQFGVQVTGGLATNAGGNEPDRSGGGAAGGQDE